MSQPSPLDQHQKEIEKWLTLGYSYAEIVEALGPEVPTSDRSLRRALDRWGIARPSQSPAEPVGTKVEGDDAILTSKPASGLDYASPDDLLLERGLQPAHWELASVTVNEWDAPTGEIMKQLKVNAKRKKPRYCIHAAEIDINLKAPNSTKDKRESRKIVCVGDQQAPYHNKYLHHAFLTFLADEQPDEGILIGDTVDLPKISRHADEPEWAATTQQCITAAGQIIYDYRVAAPATVWTKLVGNHDERLRRAVIDHIADFYNLRPAEVENLPDLPPIHSPRHLLRLDEIGVEYIEPNGSYDHAHVKLSPYLAARHGWLARKGSGASAHATLDHLGHSVIVGHTHRQSRVHQTKHTIDGRAKVKTAVETGCMCRTEEGLGYTVAPDWQNGFAVATVWPDGDYSIDLATFADGILYFRDKRYT